MGKLPAKCLRTPKLRYRHAYISLSVDTDFPVSSSTETVTSCTGKFTLYKPQFTIFLVVPLNKARHDWSDGIGPDIDTQLKGSGITASTTRATAFLVCCCSRGCVRQKPRQTPTNALYQRVSPKPLTCLSRIGAKPRALQRNVTNYHVGIFGICL